MLIVTGGVVSIEDARKHPGYDDPQYAPARKVRVELTFTVAEDGNEQELIDKVTAQASAKVQELLGDKPAKAAPKKKEAEPAGKPKPIEVVLPPEPSVEPAKPAVSAGVDMSEFDAEIETSAEPITDKELHEKARQRADALGGSVPIRKLIGTFAPAGATAFQLIQIPQERRAEFLKKLAVLTV
jgi:hypothetical protein